MSETKIQNNVAAGHRMIEYLPALILCALAWGVPALGGNLWLSACAAPDEGASAFFQNVLIALCYLTPSGPAAGFFVLLVLISSIPISYRSWSRWSRYHLSRNHPFADTAVSLTAVLSDYAACLLAGREHSRHRPLHCRRPPRFPQSGPAALQRNRVERYIHPFPNLEKCGRLFSCPHRHRALGQFCGAHPARVKNLTFGAKTP